MAAAARWVVRRWVRHGALARNRPPRTPRHRRLAVLASVGASLVLSGCLGSGPSVAAEQQSFLGCVERAGIATADLEDLDRASQFDFWQQPQALACAVTQLDERQLAAAVQAVLDDPEGYGDFVEVAQAQQRMTRVLAQDVALAQGEEAALQALERLFRARPTDEYDYGLAATGVLSVMQVVDGDLPVYREWLREQDLRDGSYALLLFFDAREGEQALVMEDRFYPLLDRLSEATE